MTERGFYIIDDQFFLDFPDPFLKGNKGKHRPHYFAINDKSTGLLWMVPMSSRVQKYQKIINDKIANGQQCDSLHVCRLDNGKWNAFLLQDMFPVTNDYIKAAYTINGNHLTLSSDVEANIVLRKAKRTLNLIHRGHRFTPTQPDVLKIERALIAKMNNN